MGMGRGWEACEGLRVAVVVVPKINSFPLPGYTLFKSLFKKAAAHNNVPANCDGSVLYTVQHCELPHLFYSVLQCLIANIIINVWRMPTLGSTSNIILLYYKVLANYLFSLR